MAVDCFTKHGRDDLNDRLEELVHGGLPEKEAARQILLEENEKLHISLNDLKKEVNPKANVESFKKPDNSEQVKKINEDYQSRIDKATSEAAQKSVTKPITINGNEEKGGSQKSSQEGSEESGQENGQEGKGLLNEKTGGESGSGEPPLISSNDENQPRVTGLRKTILDKEHIQPEIEAGISNAVRGHEDVWKEVVDEARKGTFEPTTFRNGILDRIDKGEKVTLSDTDSFKLLYDRKDIQNNISILTKSLKSAIESGDTDKQADVAEQLNYQNTQLDLNRLAIRKGGKETGRGISVLQTITDLDDLQLLKWTEELKKMFGVDTEDKIPASAKKFIDELDKKYKETFDKLNDQIEKLKQEAADAKLKSDQSASKGSTIKDKGKALADKIRKLKQPKGTKIDFTLGTWDLAVEGVAKLVEAGATIADAIKQLIDEGKIAFKTDNDKSDFENHLIDYKKNNLIDEIKETSEKNNATTITKDTVAPLRKLIKEYSNDGKYQNLNDIISAVKNDLKSTLPDLTERQIRDTYSGYGIKPETRNEVESKYKELKQQAKKVSEYEDTRAKLKELQKTPEKNVAEQEKLVRKINGLYDDVKDYMSKQGMTAELMAQPDVQAKQIEELNNKIQKQIDDKKEKLDANDFEPEEKTKDIYKNPTTIKLQGELHQLNKQFQARKNAFEYYNKPFISKLLMSGAQLKRSFVLSHVTTLAKLGAALTENIAITPIREGLGAVFYGVNKGIDLAMQKTLDIQNPIYHNLILKAGREGVPSWVAEGAAWKALGKGGRAWQDFISEIKNGYSEIGLMYGKDVFPDAPKEYKDFWYKTNKFLSYPGRTHAAIKSIPKRSEFERSYVLRKESAQRNGVNVDDPVIQADLASQAYDDATASILMKDNKFSQAWSNLIKKGWQSDNLVAQGFSFIGTELMPIVKVPSNLVLEAGRYTLGGHGAAIRIALGVIADGLNNGIEKAGGKRSQFLANRGLEKLTPKQADAILSNLKKGGLSLALNILALAIPGAIKVSPFYHKGIKNPQGVDQDEISIFGLRIPKIFQDHPIFLSMRVHATAGELYDYYRKKYPNESDIKSGYYTGVGAVMGLSHETPFMQNASNILGMLERPDSRQTESFIDNFIKSTVEPGILQDAAKFHDSQNWYDPFIGKENKRKTTDLKDYLKSGVPVEREELPLRK